MFLHEARGELGRVVKAHDMFKVVRGLLCPVKRAGEASIGSQVRPKKDTKFMMVQRPSTTLHGAHGGFLRRVDGSQRFVHRSMFFNERAVVIDDDGQTLTAPQLLENVRVGKPSNVAHDEVSFEDSFRYGIDNVLWAEERVNTDTWVFKRRTMRPLFGNCDI